MAKTPTHKNKKVLKRFADKLWSEAVRADWAGKCAICRKKGDHAHHLIPRMHHATRFDIRNGIALCFYCHTKCPRRSPHQNANGFMVWLEQHSIDTAIWYHENDIGAKRDTETKTNWWYIDRILELREYFDTPDFEAIVGVRFAAWLGENYE